MTDKTTPRPWQVPPGSCYVRDKDNHFIASTSQTNRPWGEQSDNAELIVRAVNSHDALVKACEAAWDALDDLDATSIQRATVLLEAAVALAKDEAG